MTEPDPIYNDKISAAQTWVADQHMADLRVRMASLQVEYDEWFMLRQEIVKAQKDVNDGKV